MTVEDKKDIPVAARSSSAYYYRYYFGYTGLKGRGYGESMIP